MVGLIKYYLKCTPTCLQDSLRNDSESDNSMHHKVLSKYMRNDGSIVYESIQKNGDRERVVRCCNEVRHSQLNPDVSVMRFTNVGEMIDDETEENPTKSLYVIWDNREKSKTFAIQIYCDSSCAASQIAGIIQDSLNRALRRDRHGFQIELRHQPGLTSGNKKGGAHVRQLLVNDQTREGNEVDYLLNIEMKSRDMISMAGKRHYYLDIETLDNLFSDDKEKMKFADEKIIDFCDVMNR